MTPARHSAQLLTVDEACARLRVSRWSLYNLIRSGELPSFTIGRSRRISEDALATFISDRSERAAA